MRQRHIRNGQMENAFVEAIRNEEFVVYLQTEYSVETEESLGRRPGALEESGRNYGFAGENLSLF
ncbi:hypothetical protein [Blautia sp. LMAG:36]|uniref:hypothetical protein n=1 Tax=Blautia sp. LMAG:36 TaxID=1969168 RepID=UPI00257BE5E5|nr:hypothetical protein [Blautia sp. LMAG:36]